MLILGYKHKFVEKSNTYLENMVKGKKKKQQKTFQECCLLNRPAK